MQGNNPEIISIFEANTGRCYWMARHYEQEHRGCYVSLEDFQQEALAAYWSWLCKGHHGETSERFPWMEVFHALYELSVRSYPIRIPRNRFKTLANEYAFDGNAWETIEQADEAAQEAFDRVEVEADWQCIEERWLDSQERLVCKRLMEDTPGRLIAQELGVSRSTVARMVRNVREKVSIGYK